MLDKNRLNLIFCGSFLPGYFPPRLLLIKQTMRRMSTMRATAHIIPMNQPCVVMSTWSWAYAEGHKHCLNWRQQKRVHFVDQTQLENQLLTTFCGVMGRLLRMPLSNSNPSSGCHREPVASVSVIPADGEACHIRWELLNSHLLSSGSVHWDENRQILKKNIVAY